MTWKWKEQEATQCSNIAKTSVLRVTNMLVDFKSESEKSKWNEGLRLMPGLSVLLVMQDEESLSALIAMEDLHRKNMR